jgi:hypothetical protein
MTSRKISSKALALMASAAVISLAAATPASAIVTSNASDISISLNISTLVQGTLGSFASASGVTNGLSSYADAQTLPDVAGAIGLPATGTGLSVSAASASASASGGFLPMGGASSTASSEIEGLALDLKLQGSDLITIGGANSDISSTSTATASEPAGLVATGISNISGVTLDILGESITIDADASTAPNTAVLVPGIEGLTITLNKQTIVTGFDLISIQTDALDIDFTDLHLTGAPLAETVSGEITIGESFAQVPEPAAWAEMLVGFGLVGGLARSRIRRSVAAPA